MTKRSKFIGTPALATLARLAPGQRIIPAQQVAVLEQDLQNAASAGQRIQAAEQHCLQRLEQIRVQARHEGMTAGYAQAHTKLLRFCQEISRRAKNSEAELIAMVLSSVEKILGRLAPDELVTELASGALAQVDEQFQRIVLVVHPDITIDVHALHRRLAQADADVSHLRITHDASLARDACRLVTPAGEIDASLPVQLAALSKALLERDEPQTDAQVSHV